MAAYLTLGAQSATRIRGGVQCGVCLHTWTREPSTPCPGLPRYEYGAWPAHLLTQAQCEAERLLPGPPAGVCQRAKSPQGWLRLYDKNTATAKPPKHELSAAQQEALTAANAARLAKRTCQGCKQAWPSKRELHGGLCPACWELQEMMQDRRQAIEWARNLIGGAAGEFVLLDTETTGLDDDAEILQITVIDPTGAVLLSSYVRPSLPIDETSGAFAVNGITQAMVADAPTWPDVCARLRPLLAGKLVVCYNADFDLRMVCAACQEHSVPTPDARQWVCAMDWYAQFHGEAGRRGSYRWQSLADACWQMGVTRPTHEA